MKKDGPSRKTKQYLNERMDKVSELLDKAKKNHEMMTSCGVKTHEYFTSKFINQIESNTTEATNYILKCSEEVQKSQAPNISPQTDANQMRRVKELGFRITDVQEVLDTTRNSMSDMSAVQIECQLQEIRKQWDMVSNIHMEVRVNHEDESMYPLHDQFQQLKSEYNQGFGTPVSASGQGGKAGSPMSSSCNRPSSSMGNLVYGDRYEVTSLRKKIDDEVSTLYEKCFGHKVLHQETNWVPHIICNSCRLMLYRSRNSGFQKYCRFSTPAIWKQTLRMNDCYFCMNDVKAGTTSKTKSKISYINVSTVIRPTEISPKARRSR
ncbi:unnamed protein product [Brassicogethes aeneus]|uniref:Uncharacterized protein n=1 Tax=Brassicogethes aeneus TaxID=1431903 RepID=A0A9P0B2K2_BRAAE|nr:unnamed protein product [Brassicogethes aeneus]